MKTKVKNSLRQDQQEQFFKDLYSFIKNSNVPKEFVYLAFANVLLDFLSKEEQDIHSMDDLLNAVYVQECLEYTPEDHLLLLASNIHTLIFLYNVLERNN